MRLLEKVKTQSPIVLDGGLATTLEQAGCDLNSSLWSSEVLRHQPIKIKQAHQDFTNAGADIILTSTYQGVQSSCGGEQWIYARAGSVIGGDGVRECGVGSRGDGQFPRPHVFVGVSAHFSLEADQTATAHIEAEAVLDSTQVVGFSAFGKKLSNQGEIQGIRGLHSWVGRVGRGVDAFSGRRHPSCGRGSEYFAVEAGEMRGEAAWQSLSEMGPHGPEEVGGQGRESVSIPG